MKNLIFFATLLIFVLNISDNVISAEAQDKKADPVLDYDGKEVLTGTSYYLLPTIWPGGGVTIYPVANKNCTNGVAKLASGDGLPVTLSYGGTNLGDVVRESTNLTIFFSPGILYFTAVWKVDEYDAEAEQDFVKAGEIDWEDTSINKWFQIRKGRFPGSYRFEFCTVQTCTDVGIYVYEEVGRLALDGTLSFNFYFKKFEAGTRSIGRLEA